VNCDTGLLCQWFVANKLSMNVSKTCYTVFSTRNQGTIRITVDNMELNKCKYLGVTLNEELKWKNHIGIVYGKLIKFIGIFYKYEVNYLQSRYKLFITHLSIKTFCMALKFMSIHILLI
jgi:hypothetical protein